MDRLQLYSSLIINYTTVEITGGKNKGKRGVVLGKSPIRDYSYWRGYTEYNYHHYFDVYVRNGEDVIKTSCNYVSIVN